MEPTSLLANPATYSLNGKHKHGNVVKKARKYVFALYNRHASGDPYYHTYTRALEVVGACKKLARALALPDHDCEVLLLAAWFVDSRYVTIKQDPETNSADIAQVFLKEQGCPAAKIQQVLNNIQSLQNNEPPRTLLNKILNDSYWLYLAHRDYNWQAKLIRAEREWLSGRIQSDEEWLIQCLDDFTEHPFYTELAQHVFSRQRAENRLALDRKLQKLTRPAHADLKSKEDNQLSFREIEDAFKLTSRNYVNQVGVADRKAGLLIHVSSIIISLVVAVLLRHLADNPLLLGPTVFLLLVCSVTYAFAILASRPTHGASQSMSATDEQVLFFGSFDKTDPVFERVSWETYGNQIRQLIGNTKDALFNQMSGEVYQTRQLLSRKFRYLSYAYVTFLIGMFATVLAYIIAVFLQSPTT